MSSTFIRTTEDFICENCGREVKGNGYTNHCPYCLYSKHVDVNPGDRAADCGGLMKPVAVELRKGERIIIHECDICEVQIFGPLCKRFRKKHGTNATAADYCNFHHVLLW